jgi:hypothetical protein
VAAAAGQGKPWIALTALIFRNVALLQRGADRAAFEAASVLPPEAINDSKATSHFSGFPAPSGQNGRTSYGRKAPLSGGASNSASSLSF